MRKIASSVFFLLLSVMVFAQKKTLTPDDYGKFQRMGYTSISNDGNWLATYVSTTLFDDSVLIRSLDGSNKSYSIEKATEVELSPNNQWAAYITVPSFKEKERLEKDKKPAPRGVTLLNLNNGEKVSLSDADRFTFPREGNYVVVELNGQKEKTSGGKVILLRNLATGETRTIANVREYSFNRKGELFAYIVKGENKYANTLELFDLRTQTVKILGSDTVAFSKLTWSKNGESLAYFKELTDTLHDAKEKAVSVHYHTGLYKSPVTYSYVASQYGADWRITPESSLTISEDQQIVYFGIREWTPKPPKPQPKSDSAKADSTAKPKAPPAAPKEENLADVDIWHWNDKEIQPSQKLRHTRTKSATYLASWIPAKNQFHQLTTDLNASYSFSISGNSLIYMETDIYKPALVEDYADLYYVDAATGKKSLIRKKIDITRGGISLTRNGKYVYYFQDKHWWSYNTATGNTLNITEKIGVDFWNTRDDHPGPLFSFGYSLTSKDEETIFLNTEYDVYQVRFDGKSFSRITNGKEDNNVYRVYSQFSEDRFYDPAKPLYLRKFGDLSKKVGYSALVNGKLQDLTFEDAAVSIGGKAKDANVFFVTKEKFDSPPTVYSTKDLKSFSYVHQVNQFVKDYQWGKAETISYTNKNGKKLQGTLYYPFNYEEGKQYPMIVYIYERLSDGVHYFISPNERSPYNTINFTSGGYFIFQPDIVYDINDPGISAVNCVVPAVEEVLKTGKINKDQLGIMGHSWGAYQTSFIVTQTDLFKAGVAGAPLTNMISMSLSIYWNSGVPDQKIFETSQGRFDGPWYDRMEHHMRNSPIYEAKNLKTPLLVAFGDKDGAVDWHQGIELYGTLRRMQKPHVLLVYADENHSNRKKENQIDYQIRQREWFDHFVLGKPAAKWITDGITYDEKMKAREKN